MYFAPSRPLFFFWCPYWQLMAPIGINFKVVHVHFAHNGPRWETPVDPVYPFRPHNEPIVGISPMVRLVQSSTCPSFTYVHKYTCNGPKWGNPRNVHTHFAHDVLSWEVHMEPLVARLLPQMAQLGHGSPCLKPSLPVLGPK